LIAALLKELNLQSKEKFITDAHIDTIYFGGGTPSLLTEKELDAILNSVGKWGFVHPQAEITLEANPDDLNEKNLSAWKNTGINRLSIGIQSLYDDELKWMNRAHNADEALHAFDKAQQAGFEKLSVDFIYGGPLLSDERWEKTLYWIGEKKIPHVSCYALTIEAKTPLAKVKRTTEELEASEEKQSRHFGMLMDHMEAMGYEHYEISNFALPGKRSQHNTSYWEGKPYLGIGPSAHSFNGKIRKWNIASNQKYIRSIGENIIPATSETLTDIQQLNEYVMTQLRMTEGINITAINNRFGEKYTNVLDVATQRHIKKGHLQIKDNRIILTKAGKYFADAIAADLFFNV
jgi:oxygen-independent coproporphyrinogen-3 oxidase